MLSKRIYKIARNKSRDLRIWVKDNLLGLFVFNIVLSILVLLNAAQYFKPYFYLGINAIYFIALLISIPLLGVRSKAMFLFSILFLIFASFLKIVKIDVWADRVSIYFFQSFFIGLVLLLISKNK